MSNDKVIRRREAIILIGVSGSGKSTYAEDQAREYFKNRSYSTSFVRICSADDFFTSNGKYNFDPSKLSLAHGDSVKKFVTALSFGEPAISDNTNTTIAEIAPYIAIVNAYRAKCRVIYFPVSVEDAFERNSHGVNKETIAAQQDRIMNMFEVWPRLWPSIETKG